MILDENTYVDKAENVIKGMVKENPKTGKAEIKLTTSKIRNLLAMTADIYNEVLGKGENLSEEVCARIEYLRIRFVYEAGRDVDVNRLVNDASILDILKQIKGSRKNYICFMHYMEALVAYHKFYGGRD